MSSIQPPLQLAVIVGSTREGRFGPVVARWFSRQVTPRPDFALDLIDLVDVDLPPAHPAGSHPAVEAFQQRLEAADALVVVTPEYNHSFPGALKHTLDLAGTTLQAKPVGFVAYGGMSGGLRAVEPLRVVFAELHATTVRDTVSFHGAWQRFDADGEPIDADGANAAAKIMLDQLQWWASALRTARQAHPYGS